jgi:hypothetical protein
VPPGPAKGRPEDMLHVTAIQVFFFWYRKTWMAGTRPAAGPAMMTLGCGLR